MKFHGVFVGIDRYQSDGINWLSSAARDATALHSLFTDNFAGNAALLTDDAATREGLHDELAALAQVSADEDLVVVAFSGHGSSTHALVPYDADRTRPDETLLPLGELAELLNQVQAATLVCILDCCFSGGFDAKVFVAPLEARCLDSEVQLLEQIAGKGRIVLTASAANEPAYEDNAIGHGLLTYHLLTALQGAREAVSAGKLDLYKLIELVTRNVIDASTKHRKPQHPTLRGSIDGAPSWPILVPGTAYAAAFPERIRQPATSQVHSLEAFGLPTALLDTWAQAIPGLNELQLAAINEFGVLDGQNLLVTAPTSSGKTMVGELAGLQRVTDRRRALFLLPMRALVNDKYAEFSRKYEDLGAITIRATGEISDDNTKLMAGRYDICLMTYEKFGTMVLANPHLLNQVGTIVVDEVQMLADPSRGANLEFILTLLKSRRSEGVDPQVICLSAVIGDTGGLERWLGGRQLRHETRPVPLIEGVLNGAGRYHFLAEDGNEKAESWVTLRVERQVQQPGSGHPARTEARREGKQVIVFRETKGETVGCAEYLAARLGLPAAQQALDGLPAGDPSTSSERLRRALGGGVAFHNADLNRAERQVLEAEFRREDTQLRVLVATTTLAMGVNTPASAVVIVGLSHPGNVPYAVAEYKNMVGRAGRLGYTERGESYIICSRGLDEHRAWSGYVCGMPEDIKSVFLSQAADPRTLVLRTLAALEPSTGGSVEAHLLVAFLESSFGAFQQQQINPAWRWGDAVITAILDELKGHQLIEILDGNRYRLTDLGRFAGEGAVFVDSIIRLVQVLRFATAVPNSSTLIAATQVTRELDDVYLPFNRRAKNTEHWRWPTELAHQQVAAKVQRMIAIGAADSLTGIARAKKAMACLLYASATPLAIIERHLTQHQLGEGAAGAVRATAARTRDMIPAVVRVFEFLHPGLAVGDVAERTMVRLELGVPAELAELGGILGATLTRAQYLALQKHEVVTPDQFGLAAAERLAGWLSVTVDEARGLQQVVGDARRSGDELIPPLPPPVE